MLTQQLQQVLLRQDAHRQEANITAAVVPKARPNAFANDNQGEGLFVFENVVFLWVSFLFVSNTKFR